MLAELLRHPGVEENLQLRSRFGFLAPHGGSLERGTDVVAAAAAQLARASYYAIRQPDDFRWHIPATAIDPRGSTLLGAFCAHVTAAIAVHGYYRPAIGRAVLVGGRNRALAAVVAHHLRQQLGDYRVIDDLQAIPAALRGVHPDNIVNRPPEGGVQVELPPSARDLVGEGGYAVAVATALADAAREWLTAPTGR